MIIPFTFFPLVRTTTLDLSIGKIYIYIYLPKMIQRKPRWIQKRTKIRLHPFVQSSIFRFLDFAAETHKNNTRVVLLIFSRTHDTDTDTRTHIHAYKHKRTIYKELENRETVRFHARSLYLYEP